MNMETPFPKRAQSDRAPLAMDALHFRMATELCELASLCCEVENAVGDVIENPGAPSDKPVITLQGLDRIRQSLEDLARLAKLLSQNNDVYFLDGISVGTIRNNIILEGLAERLTSSANTSKNDFEKDADVIWK